MECVAGPGGVSQFVVTLNFLDGGAIQIGEIIATLICLIARGDLCMDSRVFEPRSEGRVALIGKRASLGSSGRVRGKSVFQRYEERCPSGSDQRRDICNGIACKDPSGSFVEEVIAAMRIDLADLLKLTIRSIFADGVERWTRAVQQCW